MSVFKITDSPQYLHLDFLNAKAGNSFGLDVARELSALQRKYKKAAKPVVISSAHPKLFCSGGNLTDYRKMKAKAAGLAVNREIQKHLDNFAA